MDQADFRDDQAGSVPVPAAAGRRGWFAPAEWSGAFGDLGTLVPFLLAYVAVMKIDPAGILLTFGVATIVVGVVYRTPFPVQPMKAIGSVAATHTAAGVALTAGTFHLAALITGLVWLAIGASGMVQRLVRLVSPAVCFGVILGLGMALMLEAVKLMAASWWIAAPALAGTFVLLARRRFPVMPLLLAVGAAIALLERPGLAAALADAPIGLRLPSFTLEGFEWSHLVVATIVLVVPQLPLTFGNALVAIVAENNRLFPARPVTEKRVAISTGLMNLFAGSLGGVPMCHGAGGMAGHVRFGARTGGAPVILGTLLVVAALFFAGAVETGLALFPAPILGVILFVAGSQLALGVCDGWQQKNDRFVLIVVAALSIWNVGVAFLFGLATQWMLRRKLLEL
ncbi:MAG TPA: putative sulfate/molybdate transporter [Burkholderiales bacterium]|nr:putative sulfate/molybdate transporter [Burkholderiales bacterium]